MMLTRTLAIARLTVREAVRSKLLLSLAALLIMGLIGLPLLIAGDNTLAGKIEVILSYTMTFAIGILSLTTLWTACGGVSAEIQDRRLYLVITKPLHRHELWLGKWLGITALNTAFLILTGLIISAMAHYTIYAAGDPERIKQQVMEQYLVTHKGLAPIPPDWTHAAKEAAGELIRSGRAPKDLAPDALQQKIIEEFQIQRFTIPPGGSAQFSFQCQASARTGHTLILSYKFDSTRPERTPVAARWSVGSTPDRLTHFNVTNYPGVPATLALTSATLSDANLLTVTYHRLDKESQATLLLADRTQAPELLVPHGRLEQNLACSLFIILCRLAFLAALGLTAGCLLSTPVAIFAAFFILVLMASAGFVDSVATSGVFFTPHEGGPAEISGLDRVILHLFKAFNVITQPLTRLDPVPLLASGMLISGHTALLALGWLVGLYSTITAIVGIKLFNRRELG